MKPPYAIGPVPSLSGHAIAYQWRSLPRVRRHRASKPQGSSERVLPWQITMDQLICASLSHTHYWYEVGMLKVPAVLYHSMDQPGKICQSCSWSAEQEKILFPYPASAWSFSTLTEFHGIPPAFSTLRASVHIYTVNRHRVSPAVAYRWRLLPRVGRHRTSSRQGNSSNGGAPFSGIIISLDQLVYASLLLVS